MSRPTDDERKTVEAWIERTGYRPLGAPLKELMFPRVPFDGCKNATARQLATLWDQLTARFGPGWTAQHVDIANPRTGASRVTAFMRLTDQVLHFEAILDLKPIRLKENGIDVWCPIRQALSWLSETRKARYNYEKDKIFICNCLRCSIDHENRALVAQSSNCPGPTARREAITTKEHQVTAVTPSMSDESPPLTVTALPIISIEPYIRNVPEPVQECELPSCRYYYARYKELIEAAEEQ